VKAKGPDGRTVALAALPLVAYALACGHLGRDYAVKKRDLVFCSECGATKRVARVLAE
jgi:hypothetical protein